MRVELEVKAELEAEILQLFPSSRKILQLCSSLREILQLLPSIS